MTVVVAGIGSKFLESETHGLPGDEVETIEVSSFVAQARRAIAVSAALRIRVSLIVVIGEDDLLAVEGHIGIGHRAIAQGGINQRLVLSPGKQQLLRAIRMQQP